VFDEMLEPLPEQYPKALDVPKRWYQLMRSPQVGGAKQKSEMSMVKEERLGL